MRTMWRKAGATTTLRKPFGRVRGRVPRKDPGPPGCPADGVSMSRLPAEVKGSGFFGGTVEEADQRAKAYLGMAESAN